MEYKNLLKCLNACRSKDETRPMLLDVYSDGKTLAATNGHVLFGLNGTKHKQGHYLVNEKTSDITGIIKDGTFPDYRNTIAPGQGIYITYHINVPSWFKNIKPIKNSQPLAYLIENNGFVDFIITETKPEKYLTRLNLMYLSMFAGESISLACSEDPLNKVYIADGGKLPILWEENDWFYVVMPVKP